MASKVELTYRGLFLFSLPSILGSLLEPISGVVDSALVGHINTQWLAALSLGVILLSSFTWVFNFLIHTSTQAVSEAYARKDSELLVRKVKVAIYLSLIIGVGSSLLLYIFRYQLFDLVGAKKELVPLVESYFNVRLLGQTFLITSFTIISILRGLGKVRESFYLIMITTVLNIGLSYFLLFNTQLGISAVAWGTVVAALISLLISFNLLFKNKLISDNFFKVSVDRTQWISFGKNSFDMFCRSLILTSCFFICTRLASRLSIESLAAHQVLLELWLISSFLIDGVAVTANILAAKYKGQQDLESYRIMHRKVLDIGGLIGLGFTVLYIFFSNELWSIFSKDQNVFDVLKIAWPYIAWAQVVVAISYVYDGLLFGLGKFSFLRVQMFFAFFISFLPFVIYSIYEDSFLAIWLGLISLGVYRFFIGYFGTKRPWKEVV